VFVPLRYTEIEARAAIGQSTSYTEALRRLGLCQTGGNRTVLKRYAEEVWKIPVDHFEGSGSGDRSRIASIPLEAVLVRGSTYARTRLKQRLYRSGLKERRCAMCGQGEEWRGARMSLILDHVNGEATDNRLENLRIVCPNCAATLDTHCGRKNRKAVEPRACELCGRNYEPKRDEQRFCSRECGRRWPHTYARPGARRVQRPPYDELRR
jgi:hypothetical protein